MDEQKPSIHQGYMTHDAWAKRVDDGLKTAIEQAIVERDWARAVYFKLELQDHRAQVEKDKKSYQGL